MKTVAPKARAKTAADKLHEMQETIVQLAQRVTELEEARRREQVQSRVNAPPAPVSAPAPLQQTLTFQARR